MTGEEFVNTWNDLFRLRADVQGQDRCLDKLDFVEVVSQSINDNAQQLMNQPVSYSNIQQQQVTYTKPVSYSQHQPVSYIQPVSQSINGMYTHHHTDLS